MVRYHHQLSRHEFEPTPGDSEGGEAQPAAAMGSQRAGHDSATEQQQQASKHRLSHL